MRELLDEPGIGAEELVRRLVRDVLVVGAARWRNDIEIFYQERRQLEGERYAAVLEKRHEFEGCVIEVLQRGVAEGALADRGDPKVVAFGIIGMTMWAYHWFDPARGGEREVGELYADMILDGLRA
jgi:TetR/AcrR family transcriptional regulator, cholesterol catabolism regulator